MAELTTRLIQDTDNCAFLESGRPEIDEWLSKHALRQHKEHRVATYVWAEGEFVYGFFALTPHRLVDADVSISGHAGGPLTGYLIAKIGMRESAAQETDPVPADDGSTFMIPKAGLLVIDALIAASEASERGGGRYLFIDTTNEPPAILEALETIGFKSISPVDSPTHYIRLE